MEMDVDVNTKEVNGKELNQMSFFLKKLSIYFELQE